MGLLDIFKAGFKRRVSSPPSMVSIDGYISQGREYPTSVSGEQIVQFYETFKKIYDNSPEVQMVISVLISDILGDGFELQYIGDQRTSGEWVKKKMYEHLERIGFLNVLESMLTDMFVYGAGYLEYRQIPLERLISEVPYEIKAGDVGRKPFNTFGLFNISAKDMRIVYDEFGRIKGYVQRINGKEIRFKPEEVVFFPYKRISGMVYPESPLYVLATDLNLLYHSKQYLIRFFENDGTPEGVWIVRTEGFKTEEALERSAKELKLQLEALRKPENKRKSIVAMGEIEYKPLNKYDKDMEFKELIRHQISLVCGVYGVPVVRLGFFDKSLSERAMEVLMESYYKRIDMLQKKIEDILNKAIFSKHNLRLKFKRKYLVDEMREAQIIAILVDRELITKEEARERLGFPRELPSDSYGNAQPTSVFPENNPNVGRDNTRQEMRNVVDENMSPNNQISGKRARKGEGNDSRKSKRN